MPFIGAATLGELLLNPETPGNGGENSVIIARLTSRFDCLVHRDDIGIARRHANIAAFQRCRAGQNDIGMPGNRIPAPFIDNHRRWLLPGQPHARQILMMVKRIAGGPIDKINVGIDILLAVIVKGLARAKKHVADPGNGNEISHRIAPLGKRRIGHFKDIVAKIIGDRVAKTDPATRLAHIADHRRQSHHGPEGLLAKLLARQ